MKKILLFGFILIASASFAQRIGGDTPSDQVPKSRFLENVPEGTVFYEGFENSQRPSLPIGWTSQSLATEGFITGTAGNTPGQSNENGFWPVPLHGIFAMTNDDVCNCDKSQDRLLSPVINASGLDQLFLAFNAFQNGSGAQQASVAIKASGLPWLSLMTLPSSSNWEDYYIAIPKSYLRPGFQIRFEYDDQGNYASGLAIDDVLLSTAQKGNFSLQSFYSIREDQQGSGQFYESIPKLHAQNARYNFSGRIINNNPSIKNAKLAINISGPLSLDDTSANWNISPETTDTVFFHSSQSFSPYSIGVYSVTATVVTDSFDNNFSDNWFTQNFSVSDSVYQRVAFEDNYNTGVWLQNSTDRFGSGVYFHKADSLKAIHVNIHPATAVGARFRIKLFSYDTLTFSSFSSSQREVEAQEPGTIIRIPINEKVSKGRYLVVVEKETGGGNLVIAAKRNPRAIENNALFRKAAENWRSFPYFPQLSLITSSLNDSCSGSIQYSIQNQTCVGSNDGAIEVSLIDAPSPVTFVWSNGAGNVNSINSLSPGNYNVSVTDSAGCEYIKSFEILASDTLSFSKTTTLDSCAQSTGQIKLAISGGEQPYTITWDSTIGLNYLDQLSLGSYPVNITDDNGCMIDDTIHVGGTEALGIAFNITQPDCFDSNGLVSFTPFGTAPFSVIWNTGDTTTMLNDLEAGIYTVTIEDSIGCQTLSQAYLNNLNAPNLTIADKQNIKCFDQNDGFIEASASGGTAPYIFNWSNGDNTSTIDNLAIGIYDLTVSDASGCLSFISEKIHRNVKPLIVDLNERGNYCWKGNAGIAELLVNGGSQPYTYDWSTGATDIEISNLPADEYDVTVTDDNGCSFVKSFEIADGYAFFTLLDSTVIDTTSSFLPKNKIYISTFGGTPPFKHVWNDSIYSEDLIDVPLDTYNLLVTDQLGCVITFNHILGIGPDGIVQSEQQDNTISIYPNPVSNSEELFIRSDQIISTLTLSDINGRLLYNVSIADFHAKVRLPSLSPGVYLLRFSSPVGVMTKKLVIK
ncbi:MAG: T9SS type A sorting domain-containing protein [Salibacteraceae bacterium]